jgi:putative nucleotidyltransferase with HDIG domain
MVGVINLIEFEGNTMLEVSFADDLPKYRDAPMNAVPKYHVPAGTLRINNKRPLILQAFLGTCVGVALHCKRTGLGGIIHLLLPEPVSTGQSGQPAKYATTGLPLLIQALLDAGAARETLSASLAGGALVGPLNQQDLDLDIGGRTVEAAKKILSAFGIQIAQSETGGFFTCCLNLDLRNGEVSIEPAGQSKIQAGSRLEAPDTRSIHSAIQKIKPIPQVALKIMRLMNENKYDIDPIVKEIQKDQVITARMLQLANSSVFGVRRRITSVDHAVVYLGQDLMVRIILSAAVQGYFEQSGMGYALCKGGVYHHAVGCAQVAEALARKTRCVDPSKAYTAGLLHDIGKVVLDQYVTPARPLFYREMMETDDDVLSIEANVLKVKHTDVGAILARQWSLPEPLIQVIQHHHHPHQNTSFDPLCVLVYLADLLMSRFQAGLEIERLDTSTLASLLENIGLNRGDFAALVDAIPTSILQSAQAA